MIARSLIVLTLWLGVAGAALAQAHNVHYSLLQDPPRALPERIVLLPAEITVKEISAGGVPEKVPEWTKTASDNVTRELNALAASRKDVEFVPLPPLSTEEHDLLEEYLGVYFQVAMAAHRMTATSISGWEHKRQRFDYTLGQGLAFLKAKAGADAAMMVIGEDFVSSGGRKAAFVFAAMFGVAMPLGQSVISAGVIDLASGDLLWMNHNASVSKDLKDAAAVRDMMSAMFQVYPGLPKTAKAPN